MENSVETVENVNEDKKPSMRGNHKTNLDDKGRMYIPARFRPALKDGFVLCRYVDKDSSVVCLKVYTESAWQDFRSKFKELPQAKQGKVMRKLDLNTIEPDKQGRFSIPPELRKYAQMKPSSELMMIGGEDTAEIWSKELFDANVDDSMEDIADIFEMYGL